MSLAKEVNEHLDNILAIRAEIKRMEVEIKDDQILTNKQTGEQMEKKEVIQFIENTIDDIKKDLNKITNNGENVKEIFTNKYYVNDFSQDREIARNNLD
ncbi:MAG: hypothetical protein HOC66_05695 [Flavobacteriales bacterium]|nr:hypothetical protein [Flavobacteriales bacterium]